MTEERRKGHIELAERIATLEANQRTFGREVGELKADMKTVLAAINRTKGGWQLLLAVGAIAGGLGALIGKFMPFLPLK